MHMTLVDKNVAILAADGFDEHQMSEIQRALNKAKARIKIIAAEKGVVNGWQGDSWGHHFHVDAPIGEALGSDFDMLVLLGGARSVDKLKLNAHTRRIINHFVDANKPVAAISAGVSLLTLSPKIDGRLVSASADIAEVMTTAGARMSEDPEEIDGNLLTSNGDDLAIWVDQALDFFAEADQVKVAA
jgi:protease I